MVAARLPTEIAPRNAINDYSCSGMGIWREMLHSFVLCKLLCFLERFRVYVAPPSSFESFAGCSAIGSGRAEIYPLF